MTSKTINDLRGILFDTIEKLRNNDPNLDLNRAKAISDLSQVIINSAKAETDYIKATQSNIDTGFIVSDDAQERPKLVVKSHEDGKVQTIKRPDSTVNVRYRGG